MVSVHKQESNKSMNTEPQIKTDVEPSITIQLPERVVIAIVADYIRQRFTSIAPANGEAKTLPNGVAEQIVREHLVACARRLGDEAEKPTGNNGKPDAKHPAKSRKNPKPRADRLTHTYAGNRADFESTPAPVSAQLQSTIERVLVMTDIERANHYHGALRLHRYSHEVYQWFATLRKSATGTPVRRYFTNMRGAVTWLETVRERWHANKLQHNIPQGGVSRDTFQMSWENEHSGLGRGPTAEQTNPRSRPWTADRRAQFAAKMQAKQAYHSIDPSKQKAQVRPPATAEQILAGVYLPPMPGNNLDTAAKNGSTAAIAVTPSSAPATATPVDRQTMPE
jgi:hypothetical protein